MNRRISPYAIALLTLLGSTVPANGQVGLMAGYNRNWLADIDLGNATIELAGADGYHLGMFLNFRLPVIQVRPAIVYHRITDLQVVGPQDTTTFSIDMIDLPIDLRVRFPLLPIVKPYILAAPVLSFPSTGNDRIGPALNSSVFRVDVGFGVEINLGLRLWPEVRLGFGVTDFFGTEIDLRQEPITLERGIRLDTLMISLGASF